MKRRLSTSCAIGMAAVITLGAVAELAAQPSTGTSPESGRSSVTELGLDGGAGLSFNVAGADLFLESRYVTVFTERERTSMLPIVPGVTF
jgi:hypothetical protein